MPTTSAPHDHDPAAEGHGHAHGALFNTWSYTSDAPLSRRALERMIKRELPETIYRCKGFVQLADDPERRFVLQVVGRRVDLTADRPWGDDTPRTRIVAIAHRLALDADYLGGLFDACSADRSGSKVPAPQSVHAGT